MHVVDVAPMSAQRDFLAAGNATGVLRACVGAVRERASGVLAWVLETAGSTYAGPGTMVLFDRASHAGWLSGGCLEPELAARAADAERSAQIGFVEIDTRADEDLFSGFALGCRGRLRIALLPLHALDGIDALFERWLRGGVTLRRSLDRSGCVTFAVDGDVRHWRVPTAGAPWDDARDAWQSPLARPPEALLLGAGPETPTLLDTLARLGWLTTLVERRTRWRDAGSASRVLDATPASALRDVARADAALVMHHHFELDREALDALAESAIPFVGLLGPRRRRDDLFKLLTPAQRDALLPRLRSPVGMDLGGAGPEAISLSIAAQLQAWRAGRDAA